MSRCPVCGWRDAGDLHIELHLRSQEATDMPYGVKKSDSRWAIYNKDTGKVVGHSDTKAAAQSSANARNASHHGWKPTGKKRRRAKKSR